MADNQFIVNNQVIVSAGGMDIKVVGNTITFIIGQTNWEMSVADLEAILGSHLQLKDAAHQVVNSAIVSASNDSKNPVIIGDGIELRNGIINLSEALRRAE